MNKALPIAVVVLLGVVGGAVLARNTSDQEETQEVSLCVEGDLECIEAQYERETRDGQAESIITRILSVPAGGAGCHETAHIAGRVIASLQPETAVGLNTPELDARCDYGYLHGVFQGLAMVGRDPVKAARGHCESREGLVERDECFHAAGHGAAIVNSTLEAALGACGVLEGEAESSCAGGVYMEHVSSYLSDGARTEGYAPEPVAETEASTMCDKTREPLLLPCARKAALFWGPSTEILDLRPRCETLAGRTEDAEAVLRACGTGAGEWVRNKERWNIPDTVEETRGLNRQIVEACASVSGQQDDVILASCVEGVLTAILPGQISGRMNPDTWVDPCPSLDESGFTGSGRECSALREDLVAAVS